MSAKCESRAKGSLRSKRFRRVWEQRKTEERGFRYFACAENGARAKKFYSLHSSPCNSLLPNCTETLATQATRKEEREEIKASVTEVTRSRVSKPLLTCTRTVLHINQKNRKISNRK